MSEGSPTLEVAFEINTTGAFGNLVQLDGRIDSSTANAVAEFNRVKQASMGMVNLSGATNEVRAFGQITTQSFRNVEKSGEGLVRQMERQIEMFGKTKSEVRDMRAEMKALAAEGQGLTELATRIRTANAEIKRLESGVATIGGNGRLAGHHMQNLAFQFQDLSVQMVAAAGSSEPLKMAFMAMMQQGTQIQGIMSQAGIGIKGVGAAFGTMAKSILLATVTNPILLGIAATIAVVAGSIKLLQNAANDGANMNAYAASLGLTAKEIRNLDDVTVTFGDTAKAVFQVAGRAIWDSIGPAVTDVWNQMKELDAWLRDGAKAGINFMIGSFVGAYNFITKTWSSFPAVLGDIFYSTVNASIEAINVLIRKTVEAINYLGAQANKILPSAMRIPELSAPQVKGVANQFAGAGAKAGKAYRDELSKAIGVDYLGNMSSKVSGAISAQAQKNARDRIRAQAQEKGYLDPEKGSKTKKLSDEQKAYENALKAANDYIAAQEKETARIGKSAKEIRLMEDAIQRLNAPLDAQKLKLDQVAAAREAAYSKKAADDFNANIIQPLRDELALYGLVGPARAAAALELEKQGFIAKNMDDGIVTATARWQDYYNAKRALVEKDMAAEREALSIKRMVDDLRDAADAANRAGNAIANAFGRVGGAVADVVDILGSYGAKQAALAQAAKDNKWSEAKLTRENGQLQLASLGAVTGAAKNLFKEHSAGYQAMAAAEKALAIIQLARTAIDVAGGAARMFATMGPLAFPAVAAMLGVMASLGFAGGGGSSKKPAPTNSGTGTVLGDSSAKSESITRAIDSLKAVDTLTNNYAREMMASLKSIDSQIGSFAALLVRSGDINASAGVNTGFKTDTTGNVLSYIATGGALGAVLKKVPILGDILGGVGGVIKSLFGSKTSVIASGLSGNAQSLGSILNGGFDASYFSDVKKTKKFFGISTGSKYSTQFADADPALENQFTLILRQFNGAIAAAAGPLGVATADVQNRLNSFVVDIGKIDLQGLSGEEIQEKLTAVFGAAADKMADAAFPGFERFQKVGEGAFETLVRVASTVEQVTNSLGLLGSAARSTSIDAKLGLADQFESISAFSSAVDGYFEAFYSKEEQLAAKTTQLGNVFGSLGLTMPATMANFRALVEAQDLATAAGQSTYATLLQLAPAFADLKASMDGAKSAADVLSEQQDLQRQLLELTGNTAALRALDLAKLDPSNRALQQQIYAIQDAQEAAKAAEELRDAWTSVGDSIMDEVKRIRGLTGVGGEGSFASLLGQFNAATGAARGGDQDAAKSLPGLSQALLKAASDVATSRQELDRVQAQTAASLEATFAAIGNMTGSDAASTIATLAAAATAAQASSAPSAANDDLATEVKALRLEVAGMRAENNAGHAATAGNTGAVKKKLDDVTAASGGDAISVAAA